MEMGTVAETSQQRCRSPATARIEHDDVPSERQIAHRGSRHPASVELHLGQETCGDRECAMGRCAYPKQRAKLILQYLRHDTADPPSVKGTRIIPA